MLLPFAFFHLALAAFWATLRRCSMVMVLRRRLPPIWPPFRPMVDMYWEILGEGRGSVVGLAFVSLVESSTKR